MYIVNLKQSNPNQVRHDSLHFNDPKASAVEIIDFINAIPQKISNLSFSSVSVIPAHFGKIKSITRLNIEIGKGQSIDENIWEIPMISLNIRSCSQENFSLKILQNTALQALNIEGDFSELPQGIYHLPKLERLRIISQQLHDIPEEQHHLPVLKFLTIQNAPLTKIPASFFAGLNIAEFEIYSNVCEELPALLSDCENLTNINLSAPLKKGIPNLSNTALKYATFSNLNGEYYEACQLPASINWVRITSKNSLKTFPDLSLCNQINSINISKGEKYPKLSDDLSKLKEVTFQQILQDALPPNLSTAFNLKSIHVRQCPIIEIPDFITKIVGLRELSLYGTKIKNIPEDWASFDSLEDFTLGSDVLSIPSVEFIHKFKKLKTLNLTETYNRQRLSITSVSSGPGMPVTRQPLLVDKYSLIGKKRLPVFANNHLLRGCRFLPVNYGGGTRSKRIKTQTFLDFCSALGKSKLSRTDQEYFFDLFWDTPTVQNLPVFDFQTFLKALNINFRPLAQMLQRRLVREVLLQHFVTLKLVKSPVAFASHDPEKFLLQADSKPMLDNVRVFLRNDRSQNVLLGLQMLKTGGVPADMAEELLLLAKTHPFPEVRTDAKELLEGIMPAEWRELLENKLVFHTDPDEIKQGFWETQLTKLSKSINPKLAAFFGLLVRSKHSENSGTATDIDEFLFAIASSLGLDDKLLSKDATVFVNGKTTLKKSEIKEKLEAIGVEYAPKYSKKVTHVLIGKNPTVFDIQRTDVELLIENYLQKYLSQAAPDFLEEAEQSGDTALSENLLQFLESEDINSVKVGLEMLKTGGVPKSVLPTLLVLQKSFDDAKIRGTAKKLLERYGPADWLPLLSSRLIFKSIGKGGKETDNFNRLIKLEKETSFDAAAQLSLGFYERYERGLRFILKRGRKAGAYLQKAYEAIYDDGTLNLSSGIGYTDWRERDNLNNYYGSVSMINMSITFPQEISEIGKITYLDMHNIKVKALPRGLTNLTDLQEIDASFNGLKTLPQGLKKLDKLEILDLSQNEFETFPERLVELKALKKLDLRSQKRYKLEIPADVQAALPDCEILV